MQQDPTTAHPGPGEWRVDPSRSTLGFTTGNFIGMKVDGRFTDVDAVLHVAADPRDSSIQVTIPVRGIDTGSRMRDRDLLKKSVLHADRWPDMCFESTGIRAGADGQVTILGTLRVRDQTRTVEVAAAAAGSGPDAYRYTAAVRLNPRDFGVTHPFVRRDVEITIDVLLVRSNERPTRRSLLPDQ